ncbi:transposase [Streptomyces umbrinus]|uniref:Transposase n=1 Tax=Streptomyces umbrinus TaxID=67370 RepID=A0ABU0SJN3_9ACTN|nr:transposase [Streptomyces umbrinus]
MDRGRPGSKVHVLSDANGLPLRVGLSAANTHDSQALKPMVAHFHMGHESHAADSKPQRLHADKAYDVPHLRRWLWGKRIGVRIARKGIDSSERLGRRQPVRHTGRAVPSRSPRRAVNGSHHLRAIGLTRRTTGSPRTPLRVSAGLSPDFPHRQRRERSKPGKWRMGWAT